MNIYISFRHDLHEMESWAEKHGIHMEHFKTTCPPPTDRQGNAVNLPGEHMYGLKATCAVVDLKGKTGLWMTLGEFEFWKMCTEKTFKTGESVEISMQQFREEDPFHSFRGSVSGHKYNI